MLRAAALFAALALAACAPELSYTGGVPAPAPEEDPGCVPAAAAVSGVARLTADAVICGELAEGGSDSFTVVNTSGRDIELHAETFGGPSGCLGDTAIFVDDGLTGQTLAGDDDAGMQQCASLALLLPARATVFIRVLGEAGPYRLSVEGLSQP